MEENGAGRGGGMVCRGALCEKGEGRAPPGWGWWEGRGGERYVSWIVGWCMAMWTPGKLFGGVRGAGGQGGLRERAVVSHRGITLRKGARSGRVRRDKGDCGKGRAVVSPRRITLRKGARGGRARRGKEDGGKGRAAVSPWRITWKAGARGARARRGKRDCGKGRVVVSPRRITLRKGTRGARARRETTRRKKCRAKRKRRPGPPYLWYLEFCKIWKPR